MTRGVPRRRHALPRLRPRARSRRLALQRGRRGRRRRRAARRLHVVLRRRRRREFLLVRDHHATEEPIRASGYGPARSCATTSTSTSSLYFAGDEGVIRGPAGDGHFAAVARDDVAAVAAACPDPAAHEGRTYTLTGPRSRWPRLGPSCPAPAGLSFVDETRRGGLRVARDDYGAAGRVARGLGDTYPAIATASSPASATCRALAGRRRGRSRSCRPSAEPP